MLVGLESNFEHRMKEPMAVHWVSRTFVIPPTIIPIIRKTKPNFQSYIDKQKETVKRSKQNVHKLSLKDPIHQGVLVRNEWSNNTFIKNIISKKIVKNNSEAIKILATHEKEIQRGIEITKKLLELKD